MRVSFEIKKAELNDLFWEDNKIRNGQPYFINALNVNKIIGPKFLSVETNLIELGEFFREGMIYIAVRYPYQNVQIETNDK